MRLLVRCFVVAAVVGGCRAPAPPAVAPVTAPAAPAPAPAPAAQNPSPMAERARRHDRLVQRDEDGVHLTIDSILPKPVEVFIPRRVIGARDAWLLVHFMGATWVPQAAVAAMPEPVVVAATYLGAGSGVYGRPFANDTALYHRLLDTIRARVARVPDAPSLSKVYLSGWSAGYGAIREIIKRETNLAQVNGVLLLDGMHASYVPDRRTLAEGGTIDSTDLAPFLAFAQRAIDGRVRFVVTHSEIFPGTFVSTTESADWLLERLGVPRTPVLEWGPVGMQQLSRATRGQFEVLGFAGNTAPDHVDHIHGMSAFLSMVLARAENARR